MSLGSLAVILVLTSVISAGYYLQVVRVMFMKERPADALEREPAPLDASAGPAHIPQKELP